MTHTEERVAEPAAPELWAVHLQGPDCILAMPSEAAAEQHKALADVVDGRLPEQSLTPALAAKVVPWPFSAGAHAASLAKQEAEQW